MHLHIASLGHNGLISFCYILSFWCNASQGFWLVPITGPWGNISLRAYKLIIEILWNSVCLLTFYFNHSIMSQICTVKLSRHAQNSDMIWSLFLKWEHEFYKIYIMSSVKQVPGPRLVPMLQYLFSSSIMALFVTPRCTGFLGGGWMGGALAGDVVVGGAVVRVVGLHSSPFMAACRATIWMSNLTHLPPVPHICISESGQHWFR